MILFGNHQAPRDRSDASFDKAGMMIKDNAVDPDIAQPGLRPGQANHVVGAQQLLHRVTIDPYVVCVPHLTRPVILCSLALGRVNGVREIC
jgi:hypothetical protein